MVAGALTATEPATSSSSPADTGESCGIAAANAGSMKDLSQEFDLADLDAVVGGRRETPMELEADSLNYPFDLPFLKHLRPKHKLRRR